jgi:D-xylose transport system ATP-binding protein
MTTSAPASNGDPALRVVGLTKRFGGLTAVDDVSLAVYPGEVVGLLGDNGAGKSTLIKVVSGVFRPDGGRISLAGTDVSFDSPMDARSAGIETIYQDLALCENLDAPSNIFLGREPSRRALGILPVVDRHRMHDEARGVLDRLDIRIPRLNRPIRQMSGGQRQAVAIARAVYWNARLLIMDEPTAALGPQETAQVATLIKKLKADGLGIFLISHDIHDVFDLADRICVMKNGRVVGTARITDVSKDDVLGMIILGKCPPGAVPGPGATQ